MTKLRAIVNEGPEVMRDIIRLAKASGKARVNGVFSNPFGITAIVENTHSRRRLGSSLERFSYEWNKRKPNPDEYRRELERGYELE